MDKKCQLCEKEFENKHSLKTHMKSHTKPKQCPFVSSKKRCSQKYLSYKDTVIHLKRTHDKDAFTCTHCKDVFTSIKNRREHIIRKHDKSKLKTFEAVPCGRTFNYHSSKLKHEIKCKADGLKCPTCKKCFIKIRALSTHINKVHPEQPEEVPDVDKEFDADELMVSKTCFICVKCEFHSSNEKTTRDHIYAKHSLDHKTAPTTNEQIASMPNSENININDQNSSPIANQSPAEASNHVINKDANAEEHNSITDGKLVEKSNQISVQSASTSKNLKKFACKECEKSFAADNLLQTHMLTHGGEGTSKSISSKVKPASQNVETVENSIEIPKDSITSIESAQKEVSSENGLKKSSQLKRYKCSKCPEIFFKFDEVGIHFRNSHPEKIPVITKVNAEKTLLCNRCDKKFSQMNALREHKLTHTNKNSNAPNSNKSIENTNLKTFSCRICKTNFYQLTDWKNHSEEHKKKSFQCEICSKTFTRKATLNGHKKIHQITNQITKKVPNQKAQKASSVSLKRKPDANSKMFPEVPKKKQKTSPNVPSTTV